MSKNSIAYRRVLLKLSGEAFMGNANFGIDPRVMSRMAQEIQELVSWEVQLGLVIGGGNIFRGAGLTNIERVPADTMGMLATVMNGLAFQDALKKCDIKAHVLSAIPMNTVCEAYTQRQALSYLTKGHVVIFVAGTGNPYFTTDTAASLRAIEIKADLMIKATKVDGVYSADPQIDPTAQHFSHLTYNDVIHRKLAVMDTTAVVLCRDNNMPLRVINMGKNGALSRAIKGIDEGTLIEEKVNE